LCGSELVINIVKAGMGSLILIYSPQARNLASCVCFLICKIGVLTVRKLVRLKKVTKSM
jgi:hypothetical protein